MQRTDGQPKRRPMRQAVPVSDRWLVQHLAADRLKFEHFCAAERRARQRRLAERLRGDPAVELYRLERELAMLRWEIKALSMDNPNAGSAA